MALTLYIVCDEIYEFKYESTAISRVLLVSSTGPFHSAETAPVPPSSASLASTMMALPIVDYDNETLTVQLHAEINGQRVVLAHMSFPVRAQKPRTVVSMPFQLINVDGCPLPARPKVRLRLHLANATDVPFTGSKGKLNVAILTAARDQLRAQSHTGGPPPYPGDGGLPPYPAGPPQYPGFADGGAPPSYPQLPSMTGVPFPEANLPQPFAPPRFGGEAPSAVPPPYPYDD
jgi:hypothetical protein